LLPLLLVANCAALCSGEAPEGPGWVADVEHIPGTQIVAPPPLAEIEQGVEWLDYPACSTWWAAHHR
jgi:hypothetical protein